MRGGHHVSHGSTGGNAPLYTTSDIDEEREREHQETLRAEAMRKIMEAERMEEKRRRKLEKIRHMVLPTSQKIYADVILISSCFVLCCFTFIVSLQRFDDQF